MSLRSPGPSRIDLWDDMALVMAPLGSVSAHAHVCPALLIGLDGDIRFRRDGRWIRSHAHFVPAGVEHQLECGRTHVAIIYLLGRPGDRAPRTIPPGILEELKDHLRGTWRVQGDAQAVYRRLQDGLACRPDKQIDVRIQRAVGWIRHGADGPSSLDELAESLGLSSSRLMHLFQRELGLPFRRLRNWERMRAVVEQSAQGENLTMASLSAGFSDSSHFSRSFRQLFGIKASVVLHRGSVLTVAKEAPSALPTVP